MLVIPARCMRQCCATVRCPRPCWTFPPAHPRRRLVTPMAAAERQAPRALMHVGQVAWEASLPYQGNISSLQQPPTLQALHHLLQEAVRVLEAYHSAHPGVVNLPKLVKRVRREVDFVSEQLQAAQQQQEPQHGQHGQEHGQQEEEEQQQQGPAGGDQVHTVQVQDSEDRQKLLQGRLQGVVNNLRGFHGEIMALLELQDVTGVSVRMKAPRHADDVPTPTSSTLTNTLPGGVGTAAAAAVNGSGGAVATAIGTAVLAPAAAGGGAVHVEQGRPNQQQQQQQAQQQQAPALRGVEVDVVGHGGCCWVEVKHQEVFGTDSIHWQGSPGQGRGGLAAQVSHLLAAAAHPPNWRRWRAPSVVVYWPGGGVDAGVAAALQDMGALVAVGPGSLAALPLPPPPSALNLDTTTLCGLVSGVSNTCGRGDGPADAALDAWAARTVHWRDCLAEERRQPLLQELAPHFAVARRLIAAVPAVDQFELLLRQFGGPGEQRRWRVLKQRLEVYGLDVDSGCFELVEQQQQQGHQQQEQQGQAHQQQGQQHKEQQQGQEEEQLDPQDPLLQLLGSMGQAGAPGISLLKEAATCNGCGRRSGHAITYTAGTSAVLGDSSSNGSSSHQSSNCCASHRLLQQPPRVAALSALTEQQRVVLGLGDAAQALTLTANGGALRLASSAGVVLEAVTHRAVWLTGM